MSKFLKILYAVLLVLGCGVMSIVFLAIFQIGIASMNRGY